ncbi:MAG TPA: MATE family efflux transporter [Bryobacteraceae bacterium]|nr:MATE family efflux transporter [Bryobacteraceae bacterium]
MRSGRRPVSSRAASVILNLTTFRQELRPMLRLAAPLVMAELGWMGMGVVDTMMVGRVSARAIGAVSLGSVLFYAVAMFGSGLMLGLDTLVSQAFGAENVVDCHRSLVNAVYFSLPLAPALMLIVTFWIPLLGWFGINPAILRETVPYLRAIMWSTFPLILFFALRRYLQGMNRAAPIMFALITANLVNIAGNWILVYGNLGAPAMGAEGSGWATCTSRVYLAAVLAVYALYQGRENGLLRAPLRPDLERIRRLIALGFPAASQLTVEIGVFAAATAIIGTLDAPSLAAHQIAINTATFTYMVPLGVSSAAAVRVGQALGRGDRMAAGRAGWTALALGAGFMAAAGVALVMFPEYIARVFTTDKVVIRTAIALLSVVAMFQLFDGIQAVVTGTLRGAGDTRTPMLCHMLFYWLIGLPLGCLLCFRFHSGVVGLWIGLSVALILIGCALLAVWIRKVKIMNAQTAAV